MKTKIIGRAFIVTLAIKAALLTLVQTYSPQALTLKDAEKNPLFSLVFDKKAKPELGTFGAVFNDTDDEGYARITLAIPDGADRKAHVMKNYTKALANLELIVPQVIEAATAAEALEAKIQGGLTIE